MGYTPLWRALGGLFDYNLNRMLRELYAGMDVTQAENVVFSTYGDRVSVELKAKNLNKFGRNRTVGSAGFETVMELQSTESNETFPSTNAVDAVSSSDSADTNKTYVLEGHSADGSGNLTFVIQDVTTDGSDGQTSVALTTPIRSPTRMYLKNSGTFGSPQTAAAGTVYVHIGGATTGGVPNVAAATRMLLLPGETQSEKCATSISQSDYWFISYFSIGIGDSGGNADYVQARMEIRDVANGGVWRPLGADIVINLSSANPTIVPITPYLIVPKNHDWRVVAKTDANTAEVFAEAGGVLAAVV